MATCATCGTIEPIVGMDDRWRCPSCHRFVAKDESAAVHADEPAYGGATPDDEWEDLLDENARLKDELRSVRARASSLHDELEPYREVARRKELEARLESERLLRDLQQSLQRSTKQETSRVREQHVPPAHVLAPAHASDLMIVPGSRGSPASLCAGSVCKLRPVEEARRRPPLPTFD